MGKPITGAATVKQVFTAANWPVSFAAHATDKIIEALVAVTRNQACTFS